VAQRERDDVDELVALRVREGDLADPGSWLYAWVVVPQRRVIYVGGTGLPPEVRTWLHLHDPDPAVARVAARYPGVATAALDVLTVRLPAEVDRSVAKTMLVDQLAEAGLLAADYVGDPPGGALEPAGSAVERAVGRLVAAVAVAGSERSR